jgi:hypothetical protein
VSGQNGRATFTKITRTDDPRFGSGTVWAREGTPNFLARINIRGAAVTPETRMLAVVGRGRRAVRPITPPGRRHRLGGGAELQRQPRAHDRPHGQPVRVRHEHAPA